MSIVIVGGHDRMVAEYKKIGCPDLLVLFTNTVSHKMVKTALSEVDENRTNIVRCHTSSKSALTEILESCHA